MSQLLRAIPDRQWLFKYGRISMNFILSSRMWDVSYPNFVANSCAYSPLASQRTSVPFGPLQGVCNRSSCG